MQAYLIFACCLPLGLISGFTSGLFGVGGGIIVVPGLLLLFDLMSFHALSNYHLAVGTSLCAMVFNSVFAVWRHQRYLKLDWLLVRSLVPGVVAGIFMAAVLFPYLPRDILRTGFIVFLALLLLRFWLAVPAKSSVSVRQPKNGRDAWISFKCFPQLAGQLAGGVLIGFVSLLLGIGGGTIAIPLLGRYNLSMPSMIAVASCIGVMISVAGMLNSIYAGWQQPDLPIYSLGYVYWPAVCGISVTSFFSVRLGVHYAHHMPARWCA